MKANARTVALRATMLSAFLLLVGGTHAQAQDTATIAVSSVGGNVGDTVTVDVVVSATDPIQGFNFNICHDPSLLRIAGTTIPAAFQQANTDVTLDPQFFSAPMVAVDDPLLCPAGGCTDLSFAVITGIQAGTTAPFTGPATVLQISYEILPAAVNQTVPLTVCMGGSQIDISVARSNPAGQPFGTVAPSPGSVVVGTTPTACDPVTDLICTADPATGTDFLLSWTNGNTYASIDILVDGVLETTIAGTSTSIMLASSVVNTPGIHTFQVRGNCGGGLGSSTLTTCAVEVIILSCDDVIATGGTVDVPIRLTFDNGGDPIRGLQFGLQHPPADLTIVGLSPTPADANWESEIYDFDDFSQANLPTVIEEGNVTAFLNAANGAGIGGLANPAFEAPNNIVAIFRYQIDAGAGGTIPLNFSGLVRHNFVIFPLSLEATLGITAIVPIVDNCVITVDSNPFIRGDANYDSIIGLADVVRILQILFVGQNAVAGTVVDCDDLLDADNSESLSIVDAIYVLQYLFGGGPAMDSPFPTCGPDTGPGTALTCDVSPPNCVP